MENLILPGSEKTPYITLQSNGEISFGGVSMPEDAAEFYFGIMDWLSDYYREPNPSTDITVSFRYLNSSSSSMIFKIFDCFKRLQESGKTEISCSWYYEKSDGGMKDFIEQVTTHAENITFTIYPTDNILDAQAS